MTYVLVFAAGVSAPFIALLAFILLTEEKELRAASADTRPTGGDAFAAPFTSGAVAANSSETPNRSAEGDS